MSSSETFRVSAASCDRFQHLSMHDLFMHVQEISVRDVEAAGITRKETLDQGLLWIVARMSARMERPILYDEMVTLKTHAGKSRHMLFPRHCEIIDAEGSVIFRSCAIWALMDQKTRKTIMPAEHGIVISGEDLPEDLPWLMKIPQVSGESETFLHQASFSELDLNGHVSNLSYFRWIEDLFKED
ncbi:MAG: acyl-ACP thioesterase domain-containing protein, partial [Bulleidia sp.]